MAVVYITSSNFGKILFDNLDFNALKVKGQIWHGKSVDRFFSKFEKKFLLAFQEFLKNPEQFYNESYKKLHPEDSRRYVKQEMAPSFHRIIQCPNLNADYENLKIPESILKQSNGLEKARDLFKKKQLHYLKYPETYLVDLMGRFPMVKDELKNIAPESIVVQAINSGNTNIENVTLIELQKKVTYLIEKAFAFYDTDIKNKVILSHFAAYTSQVNKSNSFEKNQTGYSIDLIKTVLKKFNEEYKRPIKNALIDYYRMALNPELKTQDTFLLSVGFKPCRHCFEDEL
jgi:hypothetical protein